MAKNPHDSLFIRTFSDVTHARAELEAVLPRNIAERVDWSALTAVHGTFVDNALRQSHSDLLFQATMAGRPVLIHLLFEHKSSVDVFTPLQLLGYVVRILKRHTETSNPPLPLPPVIPVVLHHSETGWTASTELTPLFDPIIELVPGLADFLPKFHFVLDDISHVSDDEIRARALQPFASVVLWALRDARNATRLQASLYVWGPVLDLVHAIHGDDAVAVILSYITEVAEDLHAEQFLSAAKTAAPRSESAIMTIAEQLRQKGKLEGRLEGKLEGRAELLKAQLQHKFGPLPALVAQRIDTATQELLERWALRLLSVHTLDDVFTEG